MNEDATKIETDDVPKLNLRGAIRMVVVGIGMLAVFIAVFSVLVVVGDAIFDSSPNEAQILQDVFIETGIASSSNDAVHPPQRDIRLGLCELLPDGQVRAGGTLMNPSDKGALYTIDVSFLRSGAVDGREFAAAQIEVPVAKPSETVEWTASANGTVDGPFTCKVVAINRKALAE